MQNLDAGKSKAELELMNVAFPRSFEYTLGAFGRMERKYFFEKRGEKYHISFEFQTELIPDFQRATLIFSPLADILTYLTKTKLDYRFELMQGNSDTRYLVRPEIHRDYVVKTDLNDEAIEKLRFVLLKLYSKPMLRGDEVQEHYLFSNALRWYRKSYDGERVDRFVFLWIVFNMLYNAFWFRTHSDADKGRETDRIKNLIESGDGKGGLITEEDCKSLVAENYWLAKSMPDYAMYAPKSEISTSPSKEDVEKWHDNYLRETEGGYEDYLFNKKGLEFGKYFVLKEWKNALKEALLVIYGDRCLIFHEGHFPTDAQDWDDPHEARMALLGNVVHLVLDKLLFARRP